MEPRPYCILFILLWICIGSDAKWTSFINNVKSKFSLNFPFRRIFSFTRTNDQSQHNNRLQKISKVSSRSNGHVLIPALLVFFLGCHECRASPLDPQAIVINGPFFQGWLFRNIDHEKQLSFIVIIGSFSSKGNSSYVQHYIFCGVESPSNRKHIECFPAPDTVTITSTSPDTNFDIKWNSKEYGGFELRGDECIGHFKFDELTLQFRSFKRLPWSYTQPVTGGPEGWLGKTNLLPCHYYIYSTGSQCEYTLTEKEVNTSITSKGTIIKKYDDEMSSQSRVSSHGIMHIEGNYG